MLKSVEGAQRQQLSKVVAVELTAAESHEQKLCVRVLAIQQSSVHGDPSLNDFEVLNHALCHWVVSTRHFFLFGNLLLCLREIASQAIKVRFDELTESLRHGKEGIVKVLKSEHFVDDFRNCDSTALDFGVTTLQALDDRNNERVQVCGVHIFIL